MASDDRIADYRPRIYLPKEVQERLILTVAPKAREVARDMLRHGLPEGFARIQADFPAEPEAGAPADPPRE